MRFNEHYPGAKQGKSACGEDWAGTDRRHDQVIRCAYCTRVRACDMTLDGVRRRLKGAVTELKGFGDSEALARALKHVDAAQKWLRTGNGPSWVGE